LPAELADNLADADAVPWDARGDHLNAIRRVNQESGHSEYDLSSAVGYPD